ncbi:MAG: type II secretion system protein [Synechococcus sp.]
MRLKIAVVVAILAIAVLLGRRILGRLTYPADVGEAFLRTLANASEQYRFDCNSYPTSLEDLQGQGCRNKDYVTVGGTYERLFSPPVFSASETGGGISISVRGMGEANGVACQARVPGQPTCIIDWAERLW